jgi:CDP-diacylglycerol--glycerol-3-phosphate 3-phosphatidyltransferase
MKGDTLNTANKFTLLRLVMVPVILAVLYIGFNGSNIVALVIFITAALTDVIDGYIARRNGQVTDFGKFVDPLADKILVFSVMLWFVGQGIMPSWVVIVVIAREFMVTGLRLVAVANKRVIAAELSGKIKTVVTVTGLSFMFLPFQQWVLYVWIYAILAITIYSGVDYFVRNRDILKMDLK